MKDGFFKDFSFNGNNMLYIINSKRIPIYCLNKKIREFNIKKTFNSTGEMSFVIDYSNKNKAIYNYIIKDRTFLRLDDYGEFVVIDVVENTDGIHRYKTVSCKDIEWLMNSRCLTLVDNATDFCSVKLWDTDTTLDSLTKFMFYSGQKYGGTPSWNIDFNKCDSAINNVNHKFTGIRKQNLLKFIYENIEESYDCIPFFNSLSRTIWFKKTENAIDDTGIILTTKNLIQSIEKQCTNDSFWTKLYVEGGNLDIRRVSADGKNYAYYYDSCYDRMSDTLKLHLQDYIEKLDEMQPQYIEKHIEWANAKVPYDEANAILKNLYPIYNNYAIKLAIATKEGNEEKKKSIINEWNEWMTSSGWNKANNDDVYYESIVKNKQKELDEIVNQCKPSVFLADEDLIELDMFDKEGSYKQESFSYIKGMNEREKSDISTLLKDYAQIEIARCNEPRYTWNVSLSNFCNLKECSNFASQLNVGKYIRIYDETVDKFIKLVVVSIEYNHENPNNISITFSDKLTGHQKYPLLNEYINNYVKTMDIANANTEQIDDIKNDIDDIHTNINLVNDKIDIVVDSINYGGNVNTATYTKAGIVKPLKNSGLKIIEETYTDENNEKHDAGDLSLNLGDGLQINAEGKLTTISDLSGSNWQALDVYNDGFIVNGNLADGVVSGGYHFKWKSSGDLLYENANRTIRCSYNNSAKPAYVAPQTSKGGTT